jgi:electron transport complex protein RnfG
MNKALLKDALALTLITVVAGCLLGLVQMITAKPIAAQEEKTKQEAYKQVFSDATSFVAVDGVNPAEDAANALKQDGLDEKNEIVEILAATGSDTSDVLGYVMTITNHEAYDGELTFTMGIKTDGTVTGIAFTSLTETAGLGMKAKEDAFKNQFQDKQVDAFAYTKSGAQADNEIDALSGATITTNAVTNGVNAGISYYRYVTGGGSNE